MKTWKSFISLVTFHLRACCSKFCCPSEFGNNFWSADHFFFCLIFFWSFPTSTCHPFSRRMKRVLSEVNWDLLFQPVESCSCDQSQFLHQNAFWTPPNLLKLSSSCLLNNFKNHHLFQSSPYFQGQHMFAVPKFLKILLLFKSSVVQREDCVGNWQFLAAN